MFPLDQLAIVALTYLGTMALNKWPDFKNAGLPRMAFVLGILGQVIENLMGVGSTPSIAPTFSAAFASFGASTQFASAIGGDAAILLNGGKVWVATQIIHLVTEKLLPAFLRGVLKIKSDHA